MPYIRLYRFSPSSQPPQRIEYLHNWFHKEVNKASIEAYDTIEYTPNGGIVRPQNNKSIFLNIIKGLKMHISALEFLKTQL